MPTFIRNITFLISAMLLTCHGFAHAAPAIVDTSTSAAATSGTENRKTFYDDINRTHWAAYYNGSAIEFSYTDDHESGTWTSAGTLSYNTSEFSLTYKSISGVPYVVIAAPANTYDIVLRRGVVGTTSIVFDAEVTALDGTADDDAYSAPSIALDGNDKLWVAAVWDKYLPGSGQGPDDKVVAVARSANIVTGDISTFDVTTTLGKPDKNRGSVSLLAKGGDNMYLLSGQSSNNLEAWEYDGSDWQVRNAGGDMSWFGMEGSPISESVQTIVEASDGIYIGGGFGIYRWDGTRWLTVGGGVNNSVSAIAVSGSNLFVGGTFTDAGGVLEADRIARWDGSAWHALGNGLGSTVNCVAVSGADVYVGGWFTDAGGNAAADYIARWDGVTFHPLGSGLNNRVNTIAVNGVNIYVGGNFTNAAGIAAADYIARWDGSAWNALGTGLSGNVFAIAISGADVYLGGWFLNAGGNGAIDYITRWDGASFQQVGATFDDAVYSIAVFGGDIYAGGDFSNAGGNPLADNIARWDGASWQSVDEGLSSRASVLTATASSLYVGGGFSNAGGLAAADRIAFWDGSSWQALSGGLNARVEVVVSIGNDIYVGGGFTDAGGNNAADYIARWDGNSWHALGSGLTGNVYAIAVLGSDIYAGGSFTNAGGDINADRIARWDGSSWNALGVGLNSSVYAIATSGTDVYVGGWFTDAGGNPNADIIARWDGTSWNALGAGLTSSVDAIVISGTDVYVGGWFTDAGGNGSADYIARWDGGAWYPLGAGLGGGVNSIAIAGSDIYVGGNFNDAGGNPNADKIARWDGVSWNPLGTGVNGDVYAVEISGTDIYVGGGFTDAGGNPNANYLARWNGSAWQDVESGFDNWINTLAVSDRVVYVGGWFNFSQELTQSRNYFAWYSPTPASDLDSTSNLSATTDASGNLHLLYNNAADEVVYRKYDDGLASWQATVVLDSPAAVDSLGIARTNSGNLQALWLEGNSIKRKAAVTPFESADWPVAADTLYSTGTNVGLSVGSGEQWGRIPYFWTSGGGSPYDVMVDHLDLTHSISGNVDDGGSGVNGVSVDAGIHGSATTDIGGNYAISGVPWGESYTITPSRTGYAFTPISSSGTITGNATENFSADLNTYTISGTVTVGGNPLSGVSIDGGGLGFTTTAANGSYSFANVPHGTNYTLTPGLAGYTFSAAATGNLTGAAVHNFIGTLDAPATSNVIGTIEQNGTPVSGATVTLVTSGKTLTIVTGANGGYSFSNVTPGSGTIVVEKSGYVLINESINITPGSNTPTLEIVDASLSTPLHGYWNGFLGMVNVLELMNTGGTEVAAEVTVYDIDGSELSVFEVMVPAEAERDVVLNDVAGFSAESYGLLKVEGDGLDGRVTFYRGEGWGEEYEFVYVLPLSGGVEGVTHGLWNTYTIAPQVSRGPAGACPDKSEGQDDEGKRCNPGQPNSRSAAIKRELAPSRSSAPQTLNWLNVANLDSATHNYTVTYHEQNGNVITTATLTIPPFGKRDIQAGHEFTAPAVGLIAVTPDSLTSPYLATITRYGENFAFTTPTQPGNSAVFTLPAGGEGLNVLELGNTSNHANPVQLTWYDMNGELLKSETATLPPYAQQHYIPTDVLPEGSYGSVRITATSNIIAGVASYLPETAYYQSAREIFGTIQSGTYNTYLGMDNWLRIVNSAATTQMATINYGTTNETISVPTHGRRDILIPAGSETQNYTSFTLQSTVPGVFTASVVRSRVVDGAVDFQTAIGLR